MSNPYSCKKCVRILECVEHDPNKCGKCNRCSYGHYNNNASVITNDANPDECLPCNPRGNCEAVSCTTSNDSKCDKCELHFYIQADGTCAPCDKCQPGQQLTRNCSGSVKMDTHTCGKCPIGSYSETENAYYCENCPHISTTAADASSSPSLCICPVGFGISNDKKCNKCSADTYMDQSSTVLQEKECNKCPGNSSTDTQTQRYDVRQCRCDRGYHASLDQSHACTPCSSNTFKGAKSNARQCSSCPDGSVTFTSPPFVSVTQCVCKKGYEASSPGTTCSECPQGTYKDTIGSTLCTQCPDNSGTAGTGATALADCSCLTGYYRDNNECKACPEGKFADQRDVSECTACHSHSTTIRTDDTDTWGKFTGANTTDQCVCEPGYKTVGQGKDRKCVACAIGSWAGTYNSTECTKCIPDTTTRTNASQSQWDCLCKPGTKRTGKGCRVCDFGKYSNQLDQNGCFRCGLHMTTLKEGVASQNDCQCTEGHENASNYLCTACSANYYKSEHGNASCTACPLNSGTVGRTGSTKVDQCECNPGFEDQGDGICKPCPENKYKDDDDVTCQPCPAHSSTNGTKNNTSPDQCVCDTGYFLYPGTKECVSCTEEIPNCRKCEPRLGPRLNDMPAAKCNLADEGWTSDPAGLLAPNKCSSQDKYEFGNDVIPASVDLSNCFADAAVAPATGITCLPGCKSPQYVNTDNLPEWDPPNYQFYCDTHRRGQRVKYRSLEDADTSTCQKKCESWSDCFFFVQNDKKCEFPITGEACERREGVDYTRDDNEGWFWHMYRRNSSVGFKLVCKNDGTWSAESISTKTDAKTFFGRQCEEKKTTTPPTTTTTKPSAGDCQERDCQQKEDDVPITEISIGVAVGVVVLLVIVAVVVIVVVQRAKRKDEEDKCSREKKGKKARKDTVFSKEDVDKTIEDAMDLSPASPADGECSETALTEVDDVPT